MIFLSHGHNKDDVPHIDDGWRNDELAVVPCSWFSCDDAGEDGGGRVAWGGIGK